jgi:anti-sigma B factor antagonist
MDGRLTTVLADDADGIRTLSLIGDLDLSTSATVERQLRALCDAHARVRVEVAALEFIDAAGLGMLIHARRRARRRAHRLDLVGPLPHSLRRLVALTDVGAQLGL